MPLADSWAMYNNFDFENPLLIAEKNGTTETVYSPELWDEIRKDYSNDSSGNT